MIKLNILSFLFTGNSDLWGYANDELNPGPMRPQDDSKVLTFETCVEFVFHLAEEVKMLTTEHKVDKMTLHHINMDIKICQSALELLTPERFNKMPIDEIRKLYGRGVGQRVTWYQRYTEGGAVQNILDSVSTEEWEVPVDYLPDAERCVLSHDIVKLRCLNQVTTKQQAARVLGYSKWNGSLRTSCPFYLQVMNTKSLLLLMVLNVEKKGHKVIEIRKFLKYGILGRVLVLFKEKYGDFFCPADSSSSESITRRNSEHAETCFNQGEEDDCSCSAQ